MGESTLVALSMRLTSIAVFLAALAVALVYMVEANPKAGPLTVQAHVGINIKSDNTEEAPEVSVKNRPEGKRMKENVPTTKPVEPETRSADEPPPCSPPCDDGFECVLLNWPEEEPRECQRCAKKGEQCDPENRFFPRCCNGASPPIACTIPELGCIEV